MDDYEQIETSGTAEAPGARDSAWATDGSSTASAAVEHGIALAAGLGAKTTLLTVARTESRGQRVLDATGVTADDQRVAVHRDVTAGLVEAAGATTCWCWATRA